MYVKPRVYAIPTPCLKLLCASIPTSFKSLFFANLFLCFLLGKIIDNSNEIYYDT